MLDTFQPAEILGANGYWQDEDMDIDTRRNLIIGALDPRHDNVDQASCPGIGTLGAKTRNPGCRSGFYVISYADPENLEQVGDFVDLPAGHTVSCIDQCNYVWTGGPARRNDQAGLGPFTPGGRGRRASDLGYRSPQPEPTGRLLRADRPLAERRSHRLLARRGRRRRWASRGRAGAAGSSATPPGAGGAIRGPTRCGTPRPWDPILVAGGGIEGGPDGVAQPQTDFIHNAARPLTSKIRAAGVRAGNIVIMTEEDFTGPCSASGRIVAADITASLGGEPATNSTPASPFRMDALSAYHPTQDAPDTTGPSGVVLGALLRDLRLDGGRGLVRAGAAAHRRLRRPQPAAGGLLLRHGHRRRRRIRARCRGTSPGAATSSTSST